jgi:hypothetical protein
MTLTATNALVSVQDPGSVAVNVANGGTATITPGGVVTFALQSTSGVQRWTLQFNCPAYPSLHLLTKEWAQSQANLLQVPFPAESIGTADPSRGVQVTSTVTDGVSSIAYAQFFVVTLGAQPTEFDGNVRLVTNAALAAYTNVNGLITANANGAMAAIDGVTPAAGDRILLTMGAAGADNGIYVVTSIGGAAAPFVLTRSADMPQGSTVTRGEIFEASEGTLFTGSTWKVMNTGTSTVGTTALVIYPRYSFTTATSATPVTTSWLFAAGTPQMLSQLTGTATTGAITAVTPGVPGVSAFTVTGAGTYKAMNINW